MFSQDLKEYVYPYLSEKSKKLITTQNIEVDAKIKPLYDFYISNKRIIDIKGYQKNLSLVA